MPQAEKFILQFNHCNDKQKSVSHNVGKFVFMVDKGKPKMVSPTMTFIFSAKYDSRGSNL